jgi:hypothetical protein
MFSSLKNKIFGSTQTTPEQQADTTNQDFVGGRNGLPSVNQSKAYRAQVHCQEDDGDEEIAAKKTTVTKKPVVKKKTTVTKSLWSRRRRR